MKLQQKAIHQLNEDEKNLGKKTNLQMCEGAEQTALKKTFFVLIQKMSAVNKILVSRPKKGSTEGC